MFRDADWAAVRDAIGGLHAGWLLAGQSCLWASFLIRVRRWAVVARASEPVRFRHLLSAAQIGLLVNFTVPARLGELVRASVLARLASLPLLRALALTALDRVGDVVALLAVVGIAALGLARGARIELPPGFVGNERPLVVAGDVLRQSAVTLAVAAGMGLALLVVVDRRRDSLLARLEPALRRVSPRLAHGVVTAIRHLTSSLAAFRTGPGLARVVGWSLATWLAEALSVAGLLAAFGLPAPWYAPFVVVALTATSLAVPLTPGAIGQFHLPAIVAVLLSVPGIDLARAQAVAIVDHACTILAIAVLGVFCLLREGLSPFALLSVPERDGRRST